MSAGTPILTPAYAGADSSPVKGEGTFEQGNRIWGLEDPLTFTVQPPIR